MRDDDGRKLDHKTPEQLRLRAVGQIEQGTHPDDVAAGLRMTQAAVTPGGTVASSDQLLRWPPQGHLSAADGRCD
jgi:hypothetical protein